MLLATSWFVITTIPVLLSVLLPKVPRSMASRWRVSRKVQINSAVSKTSRPFSRLGERSFVRQPFCSLSCRRFLLVFIGKVEKVTCRSHLDWFFGSQDSSKFISFSEKQTNAKKMKLLPGMTWSSLKKVPEVSLLHSSYFDLLHGFSSCLCFIDTFVLFNCFTKYPSIIQVKLKRTGKKITQLPLETGYGDSSSMHFKTLLFLWNLKEKSICYHVIFLKSFFSLLLFVWIASPGKFIILFGIFHLVFCAVTSTLNQTSLVIVNAAIGLLCGLP